MSDRQKLCEIDRMINDEIGNGYGDDISIGTGPITEPTAAIQSDGRHNPITSLDEREST